MLYELVDKKKIKSEWYLSPVSGSREKNVFLIYSSIYVAYFTKPIFYLK